MPRPAVASWRGWIRASSPRDPGKLVLVIVTRPRAQAERTAELLRKAGHRAIIDPVLEITSLPPPSLPQATLAAVAVTSANAAHALASVPSHLPVFAVGGATAAAVERTCGRAPQVAQGDGRALGRLIEATLPATAGEVVHLAGREVRDGLGELLTASGYVYRRITVYEASPTCGMAPEAVQALGEGRVDAVLLYSPRSARLWADKVRALGLASSLRRVVATCLSPAVAVELQGLGQVAVRVAATPDQAALLRCLEAPG